MAKTQVHKSIASSLSEFGGYLKCTVCGKRQELGDVSDKLATGWPKCHGYTMTWITKVKEGKS